MIVILLISALARFQAETINCVGNPEKCQLICSNLNAKFALTETGEPSCICKPGFAAGDGSCKDIDECELEINECPKGISLCLNTIGSYRCECKADLGWTTSSASPFICVNLNECVSLNNPCGPNSCCKDLPPPSPGEAGFACAEPTVAWSEQEQLHVKVCPSGFNPPILRAENDFFPGFDFASFISPATSSIVAELRHFATPENLLMLLEHGRHEWTENIQPILDSSITPAITTLLALRSSNAGPPPRRQREVPLTGQGAEPRNARQSSVEDQQPKVTATVSKAPRRPVLKKSQAVSYSSYNSLPEIESHDTTLYRRMAEVSERSRRPF